MKDEHEENGAIKINDHRRFNPDGSLKSESSSAPNSFSEPTPVDFSESSSRLDSSSPPPSSAPSPKTGEEPELNFANFVLTLAGSAQMHLGLMPNPYTQQIEKDLDQAKQTIDLLGMLQTKTKGNLDAQEAQLLEVILSDLRLRFVEEKKNAK